MPKEGMSTATKAIVAGVAAGAVIGGAYFLLKGKAEEEPEPSFDGPSNEAAKESMKETSVKPSTTAAAPSSSSNAAAGAASSPTDSTSSGMMPSASNYSFETTDRNETALNAPQAATAQGSMPKPRDGATHFERLGVVMPLPSGWHCKEEVPPVPTISMISVSKPEFENQPPPMSPADIGKVPVVLLSVEDLSIEGLDAAEYMEKSKRMAFMQMMQMTQGMYQPTMVHEGPMSVGPFTLCLEYKQITPQIQMCVMNLLTVVEGFAYVLQIMANPETFAQYKSEVMDIARNIQLFPSAIPSSFADTSCLVIMTGTHKLQVPPSWKINPNTTTLASFSTGSMQKPDMITVCTNDDDLVLTALQDCKEESEKKVGAVTVTTLKDPSGKKRKLFTDGKFAILAQPVRNPNVTASESFLIEVLKSIEENSTPAANFYRSQARRFEFKLPSEKGALMETRVGDGAIMFAPDGIDMQNPQDASGAPALTIRVEDPSTDPDCMADLDAWHVRIQGEAAEGAVSDVKRETVAGKDAVTFVSKEMVEVGPGQREERVAKIIIFVNGPQTNMLRWEASTGNYRRSERQLNALLETYNFL